MAEQEKVAHEEKQKKTSKKERATENPEKQALSSEATGRARASGSRGPHAASLLNKNKQMGLGMILLGMLLLVTIGIFLQFNVLRVPGIPEFLPEKDTLFFMSLDFRQEVDLPDLRKTMNEWTSKSFAFDFKDPKLEPLSTGFGGYALVQPVAKDAPALPVLLLEIRDLPKARDFLNGLKPEEKLRFSLVKNFIIIATSKEAAEEIQKSVAEAVEDDNAFATHLPFLNASQKLPSASFGSFAYDLSQTLPEKKSPFLKPFQLIAGKWFVNAEGIPFWHMIGLFREKRGGLPTKRYHGDLLKYFPATAKLFLGGEDFEARVRFFDRNLSLFASFFRAYGLSIEEVEDQLLPLFRREYGFALTEENRFLLTLQLHNTTHDASQISPTTLVKEKLPTILSIVFPDVREVTLPDGTKGRELYASTDLVTVKQELIADTDVTLFHIQQKPKVSRGAGQCLAALRPPSSQERFASCDVFELLLAEKNSLLFLGTDRDLFTQALSGNVPENIRKHPRLVKKIREVLRGVNELLVLKKSMWENIVPEPLSSFLKASEEIAASLRYDKDGLELFMTL